MLQLGASRRRPRRGTVVHQGHTLKCGAKELRARPLPRALHPLPPEDLADASRMVLLRLYMFFSMFDLRGVAGVRGVLVCMFVNFNMFS